MRPKLLALFCTLCSITGFTQINETFGDGNFTSNPAWSGTTGDWVVNSSLQLQSNNTVAGSTFYLATPNTLAISAQWEFYIRLNFNTSSLNYVDVYLTASAANLSLTTLTGYFVRIGNTQDDICLYRKDAPGTATKILDGLDGITDYTDNTLKIKVTRTAAGLFTLYTDDTGTGNAYVMEGSATDATYTTSAYFGFLVKQSTSSFFKKHSIDNITVQPFASDSIPPAIRSITPVSATAVDVLFSEAVDAASSAIKTNYTISNGIGTAATAQRDAVNPSLVHLAFAGSFTNGTVYTLTVNSVRDLSGNAITNGTATFSFYTPGRYSVVVDEIMADPTPTVGLPDAEYVELKNVSGRDVNLTGWKISTATSTSGAFPAYTLPSDSFLVLTSTANAPAFAAFGRVLGVPSFPAILNGDGLVVLTSKDGTVMHAVDYRSKWFTNPVKGDGGWSLEMIDTHNPCLGDGNWKASTDARGGTPGFRNSVSGTTTDDTPPQVVRTYCPDSTMIVAVFNEPLDSTSAAKPNSYTLSNGVTISAAAPQGPLYTTVALRTATPLQRNTVYTLSVAGLTDCSGNAIGSFNNAKAGISEEPDSTDIIINEILFDPRPGAFDWVELYNRSTTIIDAGRLFIANRNALDSIASAKRLSETPFYIFPGDYLVLTTDAASIQKEYLVQTLPALLELSSLPTYPDDKGNVVLTGVQGAILDEVAYTDKWHFALLAGKSGVSLERIDPAGPSGDAGNWHSAASTAGYGTPTYKNSQYRRTDALNATIEVLAKTFSPDNDGVDDVATISYSVEASGYLATVTIFDASGRKIRSLVRNGLLGLKGSWHWDGLNDAGQKLPIGTYIIYTELFNLQGKGQQFKNTVVLARRL